MHGEEGYSRFFAYISGFTFSMLCLVMSSNFLMLFFGWEGVGLFSYLLIGFYFKRDSANEASLRAFIVNRVSDLGFLLGIASVFYYTGSIDYDTVFSALTNVDNTQTVSFLGLSFSPITLMCTLIFVGAMGKSAQFPFHTWLEGSMEGPTPISALIHAATMVTAGIFMLSRLSPMFVCSETVLSLVMIIGAITCLFMGLIATVQLDIKYVIAYCTLSQLGYMMVAEGTSGFSIGMFHLMTHAMFKALLFLSAGSVILSMHHQQDMNKMGGLKRYMPITYVSMVIGSLALSAIPPLSGFFSKDLIIEAVRITRLPGHYIVYFMVLSCTFITSFYIFRMVFMVFHGKPRMNKIIYSSLRESPASILIPLILLSFLSIFSGMLFFKLVLAPNLTVHPSIFGNTISQYNHNNLPITSIISQESFTRTPWDYIVHSWHTPAFWLSIAGIMVSYLFYVVKPNIPNYLNQFKGPSILHRILVKKYFIDSLYNLIFVKGIIFISRILWTFIDILLIDKTFFRGGATAIYSVAKNIRRVHRGYIYDYALVTLIGVVSMVIWIIFWVK
jgi:NADH-quinone oxidoreductase subunit L